MSRRSLYDRLGGYDGITAFANDLLPRLQADTQLGRSGRIAGTMALLVKSSCLSTRTYLKISNGVLVHSAWPVWADFMPSLVYRSLRRLQGCRR